MKANAGETAGRVPPRLLPLSGRARTRLHDVTFTAHEGETVAFIGSTGSGKSTLVNLVPRFYDATEGTVLVDGVDVREYDQRRCATTSAMFRRGP